MKKNLLSVFFLTCIVCFMGCTDNNCYSEKYKVNLCNSINNAYRPVLVARVMPKEEFEFMAENEEFRRAGGLRAIVVRSKQSKINHLALLTGHSSIDFSKKDTYRIYLYHVEYWRNISKLDQFLIAEIVMIK